MRYFDSWISCKQIALVQQSSSTDNVIRSLKNLEFGYKWPDALLANYPRWVRGTATPKTLINQANTSSVATFTSAHSFFHNTRIQLYAPHGRCLRLLGPDRRQLGRRTAPRRRKAAAQLHHK